jgi:hypothetical protein
MNWTASATITSKIFEDESPIWLPKENTIDFKVRVNLKPNYILNETEYINGLAIGASLEYVKKWSPEKWPLAFWDSLHLIPQRDFKYIEDEMRRIKTGKKGDPIVQKNIRPRNSNLSPYNTKKHAEQINIR